MKAGVCHNGPVDICVDGDFRVCHLDPSDFSLCGECTYFEPCQFYEKLRAELAKANIDNANTTAELNDTRAELSDAQQTARTLAESIRAIRDEVLNGRGPLECMLDNDQTNAVLSVIDDGVPADFSFAYSAKKEGE